jgi:hypothetical protein
LHTAVNVLITVTTTLNNHLGSSRLLTVSRTSGLLTVELLLLLLRLSLIEASTWGHLLLHWRITALLLSVVGLLWWIARLLRRVSTLHWWKALLTLVWIITRLWGIIWLRRIASSKALLLWRIVWHSKLLRWIRRLLLLRRISRVRRLLLLIKTR